jgi:molybdopterin-guanine dinucleotide biosynthesis protein A
MGQSDAYPPVAACILAGGASTRMGAPDKGLADVGGRPMIARIAGVLAEDATAVAIIANGDPARFAGFGVPVLPDVEGTAGRGPLAGVLAGLTWAASAVPGARYLATAPSDIPFLPDGIVAALVDRAADTDRVVTARSAAGRHPVVALWPLAAVDIVRAAVMRGDLKLGAVIAALDHRDLDVPPIRLGEATFDPLLNVNTPHDLVEARRIAELMSSDQVRTGKGHVQKT